MSIIPIPISIKSFLFKKERAAGASITATELQRRYLDAVFGYVSIRIQGGTEAEDIVADVFAAAFAAIHSVPTRPPTPTDDPVRAWLFGIARRKLADAYRKRARKPETSLDSLPLMPFSNDPEATALADEAARTLKAILAALPEIQSEALRLKYVEGLSLQEMSVILEKSPNAVSQLLFRARQTVRDRGAAYFSDTDDENEETIR